MRRLILAFALTVTACAQEESSAPGLSGLYVGEGRDRLCIAAVEPTVLRGGLIVFGPGDMNCSLAGAIEGTGASLMLIPRGDADCRIPLLADGDTLRIGNVAASCNYYCGPGASLTGKQFGKSATASFAGDLAGDPLC